MTKKNNEQINKEERPVPSSDYEFLREQIKDRPVNKKKLFRRMAFTAGSAILFGVIACAVFIVFSQVFNKRISGKDNAPLTHVELPAASSTEEELPEVEVSSEDGEHLSIVMVDENSKTGNLESQLPEETVIVETPIEEMTEVEEPPQPQTIIVEAPPTVVELELSDYQLLYQKLSALSKEVIKSMVTVTYVSKNMDWLNGEAWYENHASGMVVGNNGQELLILAKQPSRVDTDTIRITFQNGSMAEGKLLSVDTDTSFAVYGVNLKSITQETVAAAPPVTLGNSSSASVLGSAVVAVGSPLGKNSICYGAITSTDGKAQLPDASYQILTTDIYGSEHAGGVLINTKGQVIGIITEEHHEKGMEHMVYAYGITGVRKLLENLSNNTNVAYLGIVTGPVSKEAMEELGIPEGAYVLKTEMNSPAMYSGLATGDVITKLGDVTIQSQNEYLSALATFSPEQEISITFKRFSSGDYRETTIQIQTVGKYQQEE